MACKLENGRVEEPEIMRFLNELSSKISTSWPRLGTQLGLDNGRIECIGADYSTTNEKAYQMLLAWLRKEGKSWEALSQLPRAFEAIENKLLAERCLEQLAVWRSYGHNCPEAAEYFYPPVIPRHYHRRNAEKCIERMDQTLSDSLKLCQEDMEVSGKRELFQRLHFLEKLQEFEAIQNQLIENYKPSVTDQATMKWVRTLGKRHRVRAEQESQTQKLVNECLFDPRPSSAILGSSSRLDIAKLDEEIRRTKSEGNRSKWLVSRPFSKSQTSIISTESNRECYHYCQAVTTAVHHEHDEGGTLQINECEHEISTEMKEEDNERSSISSDGTKKYYWLTTKL